MKKNQINGALAGKIDKLALKIEKKARINYVASDPTRLKILLALKENEKMCTSDLAEILGLSASAVSHQKAILERFGLIASKRNGKKICCQIKDRRLAREIVKDIK